MKALFTLTSAESRRLIAKGVAAMPEVKKAWESAYLVLAGGTTNGFVAQELLCDKSIEPQRTTAGISTEIRTCMIYRTVWILSTARARRAAIPRSRAMLLNIFLSMRGSFHYDVINNIIA